MRKWQILFAQEAEADLGFFIERFPRLWKEIRQVMILLAQEDDPRHPQNPSLKVAIIEHDAPDWWRIHVGERGEQWVRVVFRLIGTRNGIGVEIERRDRVDEFDEPKAIQITYAKFRKDAYGKSLLDRYRQIRKD